MNAYLGADAIIPALDAGADVIIGGRLADPSMFLAPLAYRFGWAATDMTRMGAGTLVGHLLECGMQVTGGYFADPGVKDVANLAQCGYPIAEVEADGSAIDHQARRQRRLRHAGDGEGAIALRGARSGALSDARRHRRFQPRRRSPGRRRPRQGVERQRHRAARHAEGNGRLRRRLPGRSRRQLRRPGRAAARATGGRDRGASGWRACTASRPICAST